MLVTRRESFVEHTNVPERTICEKDSNSLEVRFLKGKGDIFLLHQYVRLGVFNFYKFALQKIRKKIV